MTADSRLPSSKQVSTTQNRFRSVTAYSGILLSLSIFVLIFCAIYIHFDYRDSLHILGVINGIYHLVFAILIFLGSKLENPNPKWLFMKAYLIQSIAGIILLVIPIIGFDIVNWYTAARNCKLNCDDHIADERSNSVKTCDSTCHAITGHYLPIILVVFVIAIVDVIIAFIIGDKIRSHQNVGKKSKKQSQTKGFEKFKNSSDSPYVISVSDVMNLQIYQPSSTVFVEIPLTTADDEDRQSQFRSYISPVHSNVY